MMVLVSDILSDEHSADLKVDSVFYDGFLKSSEVVFSTTWAGSIPKYREWASLNPVVLFWVKKIVSHFALQQGEENSI